MSLVVPRTSGHTGEQGNPLLLGEAVLSRTTVPDDERPRDGGNGGRGGHDDGGDGDIGDGCRVDSCGGRRGASREWDGGDNMEAVLWGVYRFKRGFRERVVRHSPLYDYLYSRALYWLGAQVYPRWQRAPH